MKVSSGCSYVVGCPKAGMRQNEGEGGSSKRAVGYMSKVGAALTKPNSAKVNIDEPTENLPTSVVENVN